MAVSIRVSGDCDFFGQRVESVLPAHNERINALVGEHLSRFPEIAQFLDLADGDSFQFEIHPTGVRVWAGGKKCQAEGMTSALDKILRIARYYQHLGYAPRDLSKELPLSRSSLSKVKEMQKAARPGKSDKAVALVRAGENGLSLARDIVSVVPAAGPAHPFVGSTAFVAGSIWGLFGVKELMDGVSDYTRAWEIGDGEGSRRATGRIASGMLSASASSLYLSAKTAAALPAGAAAAAGLGLASNFLFGAGAILSIGLAALGMYRCSKFDERLNSYLVNPDPHLTKQKKLEGALRFLKDQMSVTPEERAEIEERIEREFPCTPEIRETWLRKALDALTEKKVKYLKRRTSNRSLSLMLNPAKGIDFCIGQLTQGRGLKEAETLIGEIKQENRKKWNLYTLSLCAAIIGLIALVIGTIGTFGALPFAFLAISATFYLACGGYSLFQTFSGKTPDAQNGPGLQPLEIPPPISDF